MLWMNLIWGIIFLSLTGPGIWGNILIFVRHVYIFVLIPEKKSIDFIIIHLAFSNAIIICTTGIRDIAPVFYFRNFLGSVGCKTVVYLGRVARGLSICNTCLLSVVQAVTISPRTTLWGKLKPQTPWQVLPYFFLFWIANLLISSNLLRYITAVSSMNRSAIGMYVGHCYLLSSGQAVRWLFLSLMALRDVLFQGLMGWSSGHMAFRLYEHHRRVLYLHSSRLAKNSSPEMRATLNTLILMTCFLFFFWTDFIFSFYIGSTVTNETTLLYIKIFLGLGYAVLGPFVLMNRDVRVTKHWRAQREARGTTFYANPSWARAPGEGGLGPSRTQGGPRPQGVRLLLAGTRVDASCAGDSDDTVDRAAGTPSSLSQRTPVCSRFGGTVLEAGTRICSAESQLSWSSSLRIAWTEDADCPARRLSRALRRAIYTAAPGHGGVELRIHAPSPRLGRALSGEDPEQPGVPVLK
ncbi:vomeronasal type-1 receptor 4-like [Erethizon dorsatum]